jgi:hypothetical protein
VITAKLFPLARLIPLGGLTTVAAISALYICNTDHIGKGWLWASLLPLLIYLGLCFFRARKILHAEQGREREIIQAEFTAMAADRAARFWGFLFSLTAASTCVIAVAIWAYQGFLWYQQGHWIPITWLKVMQWIPETDYPYMQRLLYWLGDTNIGVVVLIGGLSVAAPLAAISWRSNNKAKFRSNDLSNLKKRS